jgi:nucleotide-binding universal stress UspA family protein
MRFAREWAVAYGAEVFLLHVVEPATALGEFGTVPAGTVQRDIPGRAKAALRESAREEFPDSKAARVMVRKGKAFDQIATVARDIEADLIIIATHGHTGMKHVLLGSTAERVARHAPCPVLILRRRADDSRSG